MSVIDEMTKSTIGITLPAAMKTYVEAQAAKGGCTDISEFIVSVLEEHQHRRVRSEIETMLLKRIDGPFEEWTDQDMVDIRREGTALIKPE